MTWLLISYAVIQLSSLILKSHFTLILYELLYIAALGVGATWIVRRIKKENNLKPLFQTIALFFLINFVLFLIYIPALLLNPSVNWTLKGETGADPVLLLAYLPIIHFAVAFFVLGLVGLTTRMATEKPEARPKAYGNED